jgi:AraC-like DNA-binding protein
MYAVRINTSINFFEKNEKSELARKPDVYRENFSDTASVGTLKRIGNQYEFNYRKSEFISKPFVACYFPIETLELNLEEFDKIEFHILFKKAKRVCVNLSLHYDDYRVRYISNYIDVNPNQKKYKLAISEFKTPPTWYEENKLKLGKLPEVTLENARTMSLESCHLLSSGIDDSYLIESIQFHKNLKVEFAVLIALGILALMFWFVFYLKIFFSDDNVVLIPVKPVDINTPISVFERICNFIAEKYQDSELTVGDIGKSLGYSKAEVSKVIKENTNLSFPQYLSEVRIAEAKRILSSNNFKTISEVGYLVGFNSPSNFYRVFKSVEDISPKEYTSSN